MSEHILIKYATIFPYKEKPDLPKDAIYDEAKGYWIINNKPLISMKEYNDDPVTKKCDMETGEDLKGE